MARPDSLPRWATDGDAVITVPSGGAQDTGHVAGTAFTAGLANWLFNTIYQWLDFFDDVTDGTASDVRINSNHAGYNEAPFELSQSASDDSASWKLMLRGKITSSRTWSVWLAASGSSTRAMLVTNAAWNGSAWELQDSSQDATAIAFTSSGYQVFSTLWKSNGSSPWTSWDAGSVTVRDIIAEAATFNNDIEVDGDIDATGAITAEGSITTEAALLGVNAILSGFVSADGNVTAGGNVSATGNVTADGDVTAGSAKLFKYGSSGVSRTVALRLSEVALNPDFKFESGNGGTANQSGISRASAGTATLSIPLRVPHGAALSGVSVQVNQGTGAITFSVVKRRQTDWASEPADPVISTIGSAGQSSGSGSGLATFTLSGISATVDNANDEYLLECTFSSTDQYLVAARVTFTDPGPRNH